MKRNPKLKILAIELIIFSLIFYPISMNSNAQMPGMGGMGYSQPGYGGMSSGMGGGMSYPTNTGYMASPSNGMMGMNGGAMGMMGMPFMGTGGTTPGNFNNPMGGMGSGGSMGPMMMMMGLNGATQMATQVVQSTGETAIMTKMMEIQMQKNAQMSVGPTLADSFFPQCKTMPAQNNRFPQTACAPNSIKNPGQLMQMYAMVSQAQTQVDSYRAVTMTGKQMGGSVGLQCFDEQGNKLMDQLHQNKEGLRALINQIKEATANFQKNVKPLLDDMNKTTRELQGFDGPANADDRKRDFTQMFGDEKCAMVLDKAKDLTGKGGLYGIRDNLRNSQSTVEEVQKNLQSGYYVKMLKADIDRLKRKDATDVASVDGTNYNMSEALFQQEKGVQASQYNQIKARIKEATGVDLPEDVHAYERGLQASQLPPEQYIKDRVKRSCANNPSYAVPPSSIVDKLTHVTPEGTLLPEDPSLQNYRDELQRIFAMDELTIEEQIARVETLESKMHGEQFRAKVSKLNKESDPTNRNQYHRVADILKSNNSYCEDWYNKAPSKSGSTTTMRELVTQEMGELGKLKGDISGNNQSIEKVIQNRIATCEGVNFSPSPKDCNANYFNVSSNKNFCIPNAQRCADAFQGCMDKARSIIDAKEQKLTATAKDYNGRMENMIKDQNKALKGIASTIKGQADQLNKYFPKGQFTLPSEDLFIGAVPTSNTNPYGTYLTGNGDMSVLENVGTKLNTLYEAMTAQEEKVKTDVLGTRRKELEAKYKEELTYWEGLIKQCQGTQTAYEQMVNQQNQQMMQKYQQDQQRFNQFCTQLQYATIGPGCAQQAQQLTQTMSQVVGQMGMGPEAWKMGQMAQTCNFMQNTQQMLQQDPILQSAATGRPDLISLCSSSNSSGVANRFNSYITTNGWQVAAVLNSKHGTNITPDQLNDCINNPAKYIQGAASTGAAAAATIPVNTNAPDSTNVNCYGLNTASLQQTNTGKYVDNLIKLNNELKGTSGNNGEGLCEYIQKKKSEMKTKMEEAPEPNDCLHQAAPAVYGGSSTFSPIETCLNARLNLEISSAPSLKDPDYANKKKEFDRFLLMGSRIQQMGSTANTLQAEAGVHLTQAMGQTPNMGCAAAAMGARNMPQPGMGGSFFGDSQFNSAIGAGARSF